MLLRNIDLLQALTDSAETRGHFVNVLMYDRHGPQPFYVSNHDWGAQTLSQYLLDDLQQSTPKVTLREKVEIVLQMLEGTIRANMLHIFLRDFTAESFLVLPPPRPGLALEPPRVVFWHIGAARRGISDPAHGLHYVGE